MSNEFVMVPRELLERYVSSVEGHGYGFDGDVEVREILDRPSEQHQGEPIGYVCGSALDAALNGRIGAESIAIRKTPTLYINKPLYTNADPGEAERFEKLYTQALSRQADIGVELAVAHELLRKAFFALLKAGHSKPLREHIKKILPIALCSTCNGYGKYQDGDSGTDEDGRAPNIVECDCDDSERMPQYRSNAEPSAPVEIDERQEFESAWSARIERLRIRERGNEFYRVQPNDLYRWNNVQDAWELWQARAALERKP